MFRFPGINLLNKYGYLLCNGGTAVDKEDKSPAFMSLAVQFRWKHPMAGNEQTDVIHSVGLC